MLAEHFLRPLLSRSFRNTALTLAVAFISTAAAQTAPTAGKWQRQMWNGLGGRYVSDLTDSPRIYQAPNSTALTDSSYSLVGTYFGVRSRGYITPTTTGYYTFWVAGDDEVQWFMSPNTSSWDARKLSGTSAATAANGWDQSYSQRTAPQCLIAGKSYYVESLHKQGGDNAHAAVAWSMQGVDATTLQNWATPAMGATATQSTNFNTGSGNTASKAIDGNLSTFNYTSSAANSWLQVDLQQNRPISSIELVNRQDTNQNRLSNFRVSVEDGNGIVVAFQDFYPTSGSVGLVETWTLPETVMGRRVKIRFNGPNRQNNYYLHLAEVKAFGPSTTLKNWSREATAVASQSTTHSSSYPASEVIDGDVNSIQHTSNVAGSWVQVDLGADRLVDTVELINRQDGEQNRLSNFRVSILNAANTVVTSSDYYLTSGSVSGALRWELPQAVTGRKVKVTLLGLNRDANYLLHLAELNVWGRTNSSVLSRGLREPIPAAVMSSYVPALTDDLDDDGIPADIELANGLDPNNRADPGLDFDNDGIKNLAEIRAGSNPQLWDNVPGILVDETWLNVPGESLDALAYKAALTRDPDVIANVTTTRAFNEGEYSIRRIRGLITAPTTGAYQFWGAADDDVSFYLSTTATKFERSLIINSHIISQEENYDIDVSQKSPLINLVAGQKYYFEIWHKQGIGRSIVSLAWKTPGGTRQLIPAQYLSSYGGDVNDQDDDDLKDDYELASALSITDDGKSPGSTQGAYGDFDGDGISNLAEMKAGTRANAIDSDGDGVSDYDELNFFNSATLANDIGAFTPVVILKGDAYTASVGVWENFGDTARQKSRRGSVIYPVTVPVSGVHAVKISISSILDGVKNEQHDFEVKLNGKRIAYKTIDILPDGTSTLALLTPWLTVGQSYNLELFVDNSYNYRRVSIDQLEILAAGGTDSNSNGTPDWVDIRLNNTNGFDATTILSKTSPATVEGKVEHFAFLTAIGATPKKAPNGRFFTDVPLTAGAVKSLSFAFENGAINQTATIQWQPTNLLLENAITLRQGDSLLLTAFQNAENASLESYTITANGQTYTQTANLPTAVAFNTPGTTNIQFTHTGVDAIPATSNISVTILPKVTIDAPLCITGHPRLWTHPSLPAGALLQFDDQVIQWQESAANSYTLLTTIPENQPLIIRQGASGPILGSLEVKSVSVRSSDLTGNIPVVGYETYEILRLPIVEIGALDNAEIRCEIMIGGVTFTNGSTSKTTRLADFDTFGVSNLEFIKPYTAHSNCHRFSIWQNSVRIAYYN